MIALSGNGERVVYTDRPLVVMLAVVERVPAVIGRGGHSSPFGHICVSVAGIHRKNPKIDSRLKMSGMMRKICSDLQRWYRGGLPFSELTMFTFYQTLSET